MSHLSIIERAKSFREARAIRQGELELGYDELLKSSECVGSALIGSDADLEQNRVAMLCSSGLEFAIGQWGIWRAGGVCVPLSSSASASELEYAIADCRPVKVLAQQQHFEMLTEVCSKLAVPLILFEEALLRNPALLPCVSSSRQAMILYTSGTTNKPKGVVTTHANIEAQIRSLVAAWGWNSDDHIPLFLPLHHIHGIINVLSCALWTGATIDSLGSFELSHVLSQIAHKRYSLFMAVPTIYVKLINGMLAAEPSQRKSWVEGFAHMRLMVSGSAALPASVHLQWTELTGQELLERYGMTEIGMAISNPLAGERRPGSVGVPLPGVQVRLKSESGQIIIAEDEPGEIQVFGPSVFSEYWDRPAETKEAFEGGWFRTGDMAVVERGYYRIMGRLSVDIIKSGGYKLSALEIEDVLLEHPAILHCGVVGVPDETWGEAVAAAIVVRRGESIELDTMRSWCKERMSPYKVPKMLRVVDELPRNAMGKVVKTAIKTLFSQEFQNHRIVPG